MRRPNLADTTAVEHAQVPYLQHHFDDMEQQFSSDTLGMWVFLATEIMFFGGMFGAYAIYRYMYPGAFASTTHYMNVTIGALNTMVLICSSLTMALAVRSAQVDNQKLLRIMLVVTLIFGFVFLGVKGYEYHQKFVEHLVPGPGFEYNNRAFAHEAQIFFFLYFAMTGFHALHMIVGAGLMTVLIVHSSQGRYSSRYYFPVEIVGLYWHFVDIVWIFLFPLLYLIGAHLHT
jgi:cytochrome c oxidase subunit 3